MFVKYDRTILSKGIERRNFVSLLIKCTSGEKSEIFFPFAGKV